MKRIPAMAFPETGKENSASALRRNMATQSVLVLEIIFNRLLDLSSI